MTARTQEQDGEMCAALLKERSIHIRYCIREKMCVCLHKTEKARVAEVTHFVVSFSVSSVLSHLSCLGPLHVSVSQGICDNSLPYNKIYLKLDIT